MADKPTIDDLTGVETTGHDWDGIRELNSPLPVWWLWILYATIIWSIGYWVAYPAWPLVSDYTKGVLGYSSRTEVINDMAEAKQRQAAQLQKLETVSLEEIRTDSDLLSFALAGGRSAYNVNCSQCHGSGAQGFAGYPNLNDDEWLWGGTLEQINFTITHGIRNNIDEDSRVSDMPAFLTDEVLTKEQISEVAGYVLSLSGKTEGATDGGKEIFEENCVACHGDDGVGNDELGAPALNNNIWLYGGDKDTVTDIISRSRGGVMPAWGKILPETTVKALTVYIHSLGGGT